MNKKPFIKVAQDLHKEQFSKARVFFAAGSMVRGEGTDKSDIDCYIVFNSKDCPRAYRETLIFQDYICECFVQNENSIEYFLAKEKDNGFPIVQSMILEGLPFGDQIYADELKQRVRELIAAGPLPLNAEQIERGRYHITDLIDDIPAKNEYELLGTLSALHQELGDFYLRANGQWSGTRKALQRALRKYNPEFAERYGKSFELAFKENEFTMLETLVEYVLAPFGGRLVITGKGYASDKANEPQKI